MKKEMTLSIFKKALLFIIVLVLIDVSSGFIFDALYSTSKSGVAYQENQVFNKTNDSILIFGSSRAAFHYKPEIITKNTGLSCYNDGREGMGIYFHYAALLATLNRYTPKVVVLDLDFRDVYDRGGNFGEDVFSDLAPFYGKINPDFDNYICRNWYDPIFYQSNLLKYNKKFFNILTANIMEGRDNYRGYRPLIGEWDGKDKVLKNDTFKISSDLIKTIDLFIAKAKAKNCKVILVVSPTLKKIKPEFFDIVNKIATQNEVPLYNYYSKPMFVNNKHLFHDLEHLNDKGATMFSELLSKEMK